MPASITYEVTTQHYEAELDTHEYIAGFRDIDRFVQLCRQCANYGRRHGCPPFVDDTLDRVGRYNRVRLLGVKITPAEQHIPLSAADELMLPVVLQMNSHLLNLERQLHGMACGFVGSCPHCDEPCSRIDGLPCRHPELVRPSLEAMGFDMVKTSSQLLGIEIQWGRDGMLPDYLMLVCGLFYNG